MIFVDYSSAISCIFLKSLSFVDPQKSLTRGQDFRLLVIKISYFFFLCAEASTQFDILFRAKRSADEWPDYRLSKHTKTNLAYGQFQRPTLFYNHLK